MIGFKMIGDLVRGAFRTIGWKGLAVLLLGMAIIFLWIRGNRFESRYHEQIEVNHRLKWEVSLAEAKFDSLKGIGLYSEIPVDTILSPYPIPVPGKTEYDTLFLVSEDLRPEPAVISQVEFDTSKWFGPVGERFGVRVYGIFHWPAKYSYRNRLLIDPLGFENTPKAPSEPRSRYSWGIAPTIAWKSQESLYAGLSLYAGRVSLFGISDFDKPSWIVGLGYRLF